MTPYEKIKEVLKELEETEIRVLGKAEDLADEYCESFYHNGSWYYPKGTSQDSLPFYEDLDLDFDDNNKSTEGIWVSSSEMC
ncbi:hypothetical protein CkP1_0139 [Citrobacter phage CkP1]|nr:hypothetical protein CkP1_0139 [Citrobacter phage CkP1]